MPLTSSDPGITPTSCAMSMCKLACKILGKSKNFSRTRISLENWVFIFSEDHSKIVMLLKCMVSLAVYNSFRVSRNTKYGQLQSLSTLFIPLHQLPPGRTINSPYFPINKYESDIFHLHIYKYGCEKYIL